MPVPTFGPFLHVARSVVYVFADAALFRCKLVWAKEMGFQIASTPRGAFVRCASQKLLVKVGLLCGGDAALYGITLAICNLHLHCA